MSKKKIDGEFKFQVNIERMKQIRDFNGIDAEIDVYKGIMKEALNHIADELKDGGCDKEAVIKALDYFKK